MPCVWRLPSLSAPGVSGWVGAWCGALWVPEGAERRYINEHHLPPFTVCAVYSVHGAVYSAEGLVLFCFVVSFLSLC